MYVIKNKPKKSIVKGFKAFFLYERFKLKGGDADPQRLVCMFCRHPHLREKHLKTYFGGVRK